MRALVVDDSSSMRRSLVYALERSGVTCEEACDGAEALRKLGTSRFDVLLTDINMPTLDGLKLIGHVRRDPANQHLPVVVISTEAGERDRSRALSLGANAFLVKPVQAQAVVSTVRGLLEKSVP